MQIIEKKMQKASSRLCLILLGEEWTGKSSAGNTMLGRNRFTAGSDTEHVMQCSGVIEGRNVTIVDTPGWDVKCSPDVPLKMLEKAYTSALLTCQSFHVLLLTIPISQDQAWNQKFVQRMLNVLRLFNDDMWNHTMLLFTRSNLLHSSEGLEGYLKGNGKPFQSLVEKCKHRYHVINNHAQNDFKQVRELLEKIEQMVQKNNGQTLQLITSEQEVGTLQDNRGMIYECSKMKEHKEVQNCFRLEDYMFKSLRPEENDPPDTTEQNELQGENRNLAMSREDNTEIINTEKNTSQISWDLSITCDFYTCDDVSNPQSIMMTCVLQISVGWRKLKPSCQISWVSFTVCGDDIAWLFIIVLYLLVSSLSLIYKTCEGSNDTRHEARKTLLTQFGKHEQELSNENQGAFHSLLWLIQNKSTKSLDDEKKAEEEEEEGGGGGGGEEKVTLQQSNKDKEENQTQQIIEANEKMQFKMDDSKGIPEHEWNKDNHQLQHDIMEDGKPRLQNNKRNDEEMEQQSKTKQLNLQDNDKSRNNSWDGGVKKIHQKPEMVKYKKVPKHSRREQTKEMPQLKRKSDYQMITHQSKRCKDEMISKHIIKDMEKIPSDNRRGSKQDSLQDNRRDSKQEKPRDNRRGFKQEIHQDEKRGSEQEIPQDNRGRSKQKINHGKRRGSTHEIPKDNIRVSKQAISQDNRWGSKRVIPQNNKSGSKQEIHQDNKSGSKQNIPQDNRRGSNQEISQDNRRGSKQELPQGNWGKRDFKQEIHLDNKRGSKQEINHENRRGTKQEVSQDNRRGFKLEISQNNRRDSKKEIPQNNRICSKQEINHDNRKGSKQEIFQDNREGSKQEISQDNREGSKQEIPQDNREGSKQEILQDNRRGSKQGISQDNRKDYKQVIPKDNRQGFKQNINHDNRRGSKHEIPKDNRRGSKQEIPQKNQKGSNQEIHEDNKRGSKKHILQNNRKGSNQEISQDRKRGSKQEKPQDDKRRGDTKWLLQTNKKAEKKQIQQSRRKTKKIIPLYTRGAEVIKKTQGQQVEGINLNLGKNQPTKDISDFTDVKDIKKSAHTCQVGRRGQPPEARAVSSRLNRRDAREEDARQHGDVRKIRRSKSLERFIEFYNAGEEDTRQYGDVRKIRRSKSLERFIEFNISLICMFVVCGRKLEYLDENQQARGEHGNSVHTDSRRELNLEPGGARQQCSLLSLKNIIFIFASR
ncbi:uncharacterized protein Hap1MRO34_004081 isoform 3-T3 [Clarias gariepinus]|uniref:uncharacterized protein LOC128526378 isoform X3 n=1 Tax=Clarias gariepinus TaxID=13013 RepID=UPI00234DDE38|nr:uncharacterized protein LOC128526378 isoform X3 [Clarias gariepinus]